MCKELDASPGGRAVVVPGCDHDAILPVPVPVAIAGWWTLTAVSQHPTRLFGRFRGGVITDLPGTIAYRLLSRFVRREVERTVTEPVSGSQFLVVLDCGFDDVPEPEHLMASRFQTLAS